MSNVSILASLVPTAGKVELQVLLHERRLPVAIHLYDLYWH